MAFGIETARLNEITGRHAAALARAEATISYALITDSDLNPIEVFAVLKWLSAVRFEVLIDAEHREPTETDFIAFADAVREAAAA
jgi:hypothetical protein